MTDLLHSVPRNMKTPENENLSPAEELHHISKQLEELISLLKVSTAHTEEIWSSPIRTAITTASRPSGRNSRRS